MHRLFKNYNDRTRYTFVVINFGAQKNVYENNFA